MNADNKIPHHYTPELFFELLGFPKKLLKVRYGISRSTYGYNKIKYGEHSRQFLLFYEPNPKSLQKNTVVVFFHGGGWHLGKPDMFPKIADYFLERGYPVVLPGYRLCPKHSFKEMREDLDSIVLAIRAWQKDNGILDKKILLAGMSAGANLAAHLLFDRKHLENIGLQQDIFCGLFSCGGPLDLDAMPDSIPLKNFTGGPHRSQKFEAANPVRLIEGSKPLPVLIIHGTKDAVVPYPASISFIEKYKKTGPVQLLTLENKQHLDTLLWAVDEPEQQRVLDKWLENHAF